MSPPGPSRLPEAAAVAARLRAAGCVFAEEEAGLLLDAATGPALESLVVRRVAGEPLEHLLGWAAFDGLRVAVDPGVFVPRRRSEWLVELTVGHGGPTPVVVDLCCGSGAIGAAVAARVPGAEVWAVDVDPLAVACARRNLPSARVRAGDLYAALPVELRGRVDVLVVNAPYVPTASIATMPSEARDHEPLRSLDGGADGVDLHRRIAEGASPWLAPGGVVVIETSRRQAPLTADACRCAGLHPRVEVDSVRDATAVVAGLSPRRPTSRTSSTP